jgi:nucleotide-binding universal stress UspA family protein
MQTVVVGVEDAHSALDALALARRLAEPAGRLLLVCVYSGDPVYAGEGGHAYQRALRADAEATVARLAGSPGTATRAVAASHPAWGLQRVAIEERAQLIVVGSSHAGPLRRILPGSTGEHLLGGAPCPVAIAPCGYRKREDDPIAVVGCAYDGTPEARAALASAENLALRLDARLHALRVVETPEASVHERDELRRATAQLHPDVAAEPVILCGEPAEELVRASHSLDLLVAGSRGYGPLHAVLAGATSGRVIRSAACPTIVVARAAAGAIRGNRRVVTASAV